VEDRCTTVQVQGAAIRQQMRALAEKYDEIVIDVGGRDTGSLRAALTVADAILIPFQPRSVDLWTASQIGALVAEARHVNERLRALAILNVGQLMKEAFLLEMERKRQIGETMLSGKVAAARQSR
jgi:cellulose biosynthesis protein BcsQ